jgi:hypothetical protein
LGKVLLRHWCWYRRASTARGAALALGFPGHLARYYDLPDRRRLLPFLARRGFTRLRSEAVQESDSTLAR